VSKPWRSNASFRQRHVRIADAFRIEYAPSVKPETWIKSAVTLGSVALVVARIARPEWQVDATSLGFLVVAVLPWLAAIFESIQFPGGGGVTFREAVERAKESGDRIISASPPPVRAEGGPAGGLSVTGKPVERSAPLTTTDPNLAFVSLRIDLERAMAGIAQRRGVAGRTTRELVRNLVQAGVLPEDVGTALNNLIYVGNLAAHGKPIDRKTGDWARENGREVLAALERIAAKAAG
jgi:hypothetical protein